MKKTLTIFFLLTLQLYSQDYMNIKYTDLAYKYALIDDITEITFNAGGTEMTVTLTDASSNTDELSSIVETTFDDEILGGGSPLPVELVSFTAMLYENPQRIILSWITATEVDNYGFEVERARLRPKERDYAEASWETLGFVEGSGNSNSPKEYSFTDNLDFNPNHNLEYRLKQINSDGSYEYSHSISVEIGVPTKFELKQNYPNPFNPSTTIEYHIPKGVRQLMDVTLKVYDMLGREFSTLVNEQQTAGRYTVEFNPSVYELRLASGTYIYKLTIGEFVSSKKLLLMK